MSFTIFQKKRRPFQAIKTRSSKTRKLDIFPKGLTHVLGPKIAIFPTFFSRECRPEKFLLRYSRTKKRLSRLQKQQVQKVEKLTFFQRGFHGFGPKMAIIPTFIFQEIQSRKMSFTIFWKGKTPFQAIKTGSLKGRKIHSFPKGLTHGFDPKMAIFPTFFFS